MSPSPPPTEREWAIGQILAARFGHVSPERLLSGPGLVNLYAALAELEGWPAEDLTPADITDRALAGTCPHCQEVLELFCGALGTAAGNLAITLGARGGVYIGGGIVPRLGNFFRPFDVSKPLRGQGPVQHLPGGDPDLGDHRRQSGACAAWRRRWLDRRVQSAEYSSVLRQLIDLGGHDEVVFVQAADFVSIKQYVGVPPTKAECQGDALPLRPVADPVDERQSGGEILEFETPFQPGAIFPATASRVLASTRLSASLG
jgi:hypothetical protein